MTVRDLDEQVVLALAQLVETLPGVDAADTVPRTDISAAPGVADLELALAKRRSEALAASDTTEGGQAGTSSQHALAESLRRTGRILHQLGRHSEAVAVLRDALSHAEGLSNGYQAQVRSDLGTSLGASGQMRAASEEIDLAVALLRSEGNALLHDLCTALGRAAILQGRLAGAGLVSEEKARARILKIETESVEVARKLSTRDGDSETARSRLAVALSNLGDTLIYANQHESGLEHLREAIRLKSTLNPARYGMSWAFSVINLALGCGRLGLPFDAQPALAHAEQRVVAAAAHGNRPAQEGVVHLAAARLSLDRSESETATALAIGRAKAVLESLSGGVVGIDAWVVDRLQQEPSTGNTTRPGVA